MLPDLNWLTDPTVFQVNRLAPHSDHVCYATAAEAGKRALTICTVTDNLVTKEELSPAERQGSLTQMMEIALETAVRMAKR